MKSPISHWFSNLRLTDSKHWIKYGLATYYTLMWLRLYGIRVPLPEFVSIDHPEVIARAIDELLKTKGACVLRTVVSRGLRVCLAAEEMGINLQGVTLRAGGEACTPAKARAIQRSGARFVPSYGMTEAGTLGTGCAQPLHSDDIHLFKDAFACISYPHHLPGVDSSVPALNLTTLSSTAPKVLLNFQSDDYGIIEERHCGCEFEMYGYTTLLRGIRSYSKLTGEGVTLIGNEIQEILEQSLPSRFGGNPLDYQLMEEEDSQGFTRLSLVISPRVEIEDDQVVIQYLLEALRESSSMGDAARAVWQSAQTIQIKRIEPLWTERGKLMPLHLVRPENSD